MQKLISTCRRYIYGIRKRLKIPYVKFMSIKKIGIETNSKRNKKIIVSLTSYHKRFSTLDSCVKTLLLQTMKPNKIILYIVEDDKKYLPEKVLKLQKYGLEIRYVKDDLRPHKKYYYAMKEFPNDIVITTDDDCLYSKYLVEELYKTYKKFPHAITAGRARNIRVKNGEFLSYNTWDLTEKSFKPSLSLLATGVGGVLYPPHLLKLSELLNVNEINKYISVDDLWLKAVELVGRVPVVLCDSKVDRVRIELPGAAENGLTKVNVELNQNDMYWSLLNREYNLISKFTD
ncbi:glycosyltransferase [Ligilactobacillus salivarius]|uniref:Glycosyltransferase n=3 Tax=Ligilactobacillus salivarius TaxID=1624 RepID=A0ABD6XE75_9LACO|nr:glycosyltransferase [Ligilactobacillus salivarius]NRD05199.1 glycosyltransferase [Ligilactobacillus salivarius]PTR94676.1 glycosyltransferase [Ligilactobacillus salivarius]PTS02336.1 glycosyltransferase [Ligilactobacillus salivarius]PTU88920.1 glycosyltransferase [Ligilactobacillus salivarius]PTU90883.1 glycosyltransferase [Ligilactobacillus salivarius]